MSNYYSPTTTKQDAVPLSSFNSSWPRADNIAKGPAKSPEAPYSNFAPYRNGVSNGAVSGYSNGNIAGIKDTKTIANQANATKNTTDLTRESTTDVSIGASTTTTESTTVVAADFEAQLATIISQVPWLKFQITAQLDVAWFTEHAAASFAALFRSVSKKTTHNVSAQIIRHIRESMTRTFDELETMTFEDDTTEITQDWQGSLSAAALASLTTTFTPAACLDPRVPHWGPGGPYPFTGPIGPGPYIGPGPVIPPIIPIPYPQPRSVAPPPNLSSAQWIWTRECIPFPTTFPPAGPRPFRKTVFFNEYVDSATIDIACDNYYTLYVNGYLVGSSVPVGARDGGSLEWKIARRYTVRLPTASYCASIAVYAEQGTAAAQAGLAASCVFWSSVLPDPNTYRFSTDASWLTVPNLPPSGFIQPAFDDRNWDKATSRDRLILRFLGEVVFIKPTANTTDTPVALTNVPGNDDAQRRPPLS